jgi:hypothetical protein
MHEVVLLRMAPPLLYVRAFTGIFRHCNKSTTGFFEIKSVIKMQFLARFFKLWAHYQVLGQVRGQQSHNEATGLAPTLH